MALLGNIIWFVTGGWFLGILYFVGSLFFLPLMPLLLPFVGFSFWPMGRQVISRSDYELFQKYHGNKITKFQKAIDAIGFVVNVLWIFTFGIVLAFAHLMAAILNLMLIWTIVAIPNIIGNWKMIWIALAPFNRVIVSNDLAKEINLFAEKYKAGMIKK